MDEYVARQAVFDSKLKVIGYELLFRSGPENFFVGKDGTRASQQVIERALNTFVLGRLSVGARAFVNVTPQLILDGSVSLLPPGQTVLELVGKELQGEALLSACRTLSGQGYWIAVDDFTRSRAAEPMVAKADLLKVDFLQVGPEERRELAAARRSGGARLVAMKLESRDQLIEAMQLGYSFFPGNVLSHPAMISRKEIPPQKTTYLRLMGEVNKEGVGLEELERTLRQDLALSLKLLRYINSALFSLNRKVDSIRQAIAMVGTDQIRKWVSLLAVTALAEDRPQELVVMSLVRGRFCEELGRRRSKPHPGCDLFLIGLLSLIDAILGRPKEELLADLPLSADLKAALLRGSGESGRLLQLAIAYEQAHWDEIPLCADGLGVDISRLPGSYREAVAWADEIHKSGL